MFLFVRLLVRTSRIGKNDFPYLIFIPLIIFSKTINIVHRECKNIFLSKTYSIFCESLTLVDLPNLERVIWNVHIQIGMLPAVQRNEILFSFNNKTRMATRLNFGRHYIWINVQICDARHQTSVHSQKNTMRLDVHCLAWRDKKHQFQMLGY